MPLFERYIAVDWSAANVPTRGKDSIWIGECDTAGNGPDPVNIPTRAAAMAHLEARLLAARARRERVMLGFDFVFGFPRGTARELTGRDDWQAIWALLADLIEDGDDNRSNRFEVAGKLNRRIGAPHFWGRPHQHEYPDLDPKRPVHGYPRLPERRRAEAEVGSTQPVWKLTYTGSVGSQSLLGIARLERLRRHPTLGSDIAVWPFETGFAGTCEKPIWLVEIYPSLFDRDRGIEPADKGQVLAASRGFARADREGRLGQLLSSATSLPPEDELLVLREEGWIAGAGHAPLLHLLAAPELPAAESQASAAYIRDPKAIYEESFATIRREADLHHLPEPLHESAIRMIHASGMVDLAADIIGSADVAQAVREAIGGGAPILCDCEMVRSGIIRRKLPAATELVVTLNEAGVPALAETLGTTRSAAAVELWVPRLAGAVVVIGNAPTALFHLLEKLAGGAPRPAAIIATPVGFVGAAESKAMLATTPQNVPFLTVRGRRGGSAMAAAALNAIVGGLAA